MRIINNITEGHKEAVTDGGMALDLYRAAVYVDGVRTLEWEARDKRDGAVVARAQSLRFMRNKLRMMEAA